MLSSVVGEGNSPTTASLFKQHIRFFEFFFKKNSDAASGATAANRECECVITSSSSERVADSLFSFEKYSSVALTGYGPTVIFSYL
jgi:hypothetical protein